MSELAFNRAILEKHNRLLSWLLAILVVANLALIFGFIRMNTKLPLIVYSKEGQIEVLKTRTLEMDEAFLKDFTKMIVSQYLSFSVDSLPKQIEEIKSYLSSKPVEAILNSYKSNQAAIEKENISQQFIVSNTVITKKADPFWIEVEGVRNIHANGNDKSVPMTYVIEVKKVKATETNPYGFLMTDIIEKDKPANKGQTK